MTFTKSSAAIPEGTDILFKIQQDLRHMTLSQRAEINQCPVNEIPICPNNLSVENETIAAERRRVGEAGRAPGAAYQQDECDGS